MLIAEKKHDLYNFLLLKNNWNMIPIKTLTKLLTILYAIFLVLIVIRLYRVSASYKYNYVACIIIIMRKPECLSVHKFQVGCFEKVQLC